MIAAEAPESARTIVVAPPYDWSPSQALADDLLDETAGAPWLAPAPLASLSSAPDTERGVDRQPPASNKSPGELSADYLNQVRAVGTELAGYQSMLYKPSGGYTQFLDEAMIATESAAWRGRGAPRGKALADSLSRYIAGAEKKVKIIASSQVPMGGSSGLVPFSVQNGLLHQTIAVRVVVSVDNVHGRTSQLTVGHFQDVLIIPPGAAPHRQAARLGGPAGIHRHPRQPGQRGRDAAAGRRARVHHRAVDQVRPGHLVPHRGRDRRPRAHLGVPRGPAADARGRPISSTKRRIHQVAS